MKPIAVIAESDISFKEDTIWTLFEDILFDIPEEGDTIKIWEPLSSQAGKARVVTVHHPAQVLLLEPDWESFGNGD